MTGTDSALPTPAQRSALRLVLLTVFVDLVGFAIVLPLLPSYGAKYGASDAAIGALVASYSLMQLLFAPWWGRLSDRIGRRPVLLIGLVGSAASYLLFGFAGSFLVLLISRVVAGGCGSIVNVAQATLADVTSREHRARAMGLIGAAFGVAFIIGPALGGFSSRWGEAAPGLVAATLSGANFFAALFLLPETRAIADRSRTQARARWSTLLAPLGIMFLETFAFTVIYVVFPLYGERSLGFGVPAFRGAEPGLRSRGNLVSLRLHRSRHGRGARLAGGQARAPIRRASRHGRGLFLPDNRVGALAAEFSSRHFPGVETPDPSRCPCSGVRGYGTRGAHRCELRLPDYKT
jgi:multidrug resistance protein